MVLIFIPRKAYCLWIVFRKNLIILRKLSNNSIHNSSLVNYPIENTMEHFRLHRMCKQALKGIKGGCDLREKIKVPGYAKSRNSRFLQLQFRSWMDSSLDSCSLHLTKNRYSGKEFLLNPDVIYETVDSMIYARHVWYIPDNFGTLFVNGTNG